MASHIVLIVGSYWFSFLIHYDFSLNSSATGLMLRTLPFLLLIKISIFYFLGLFYGFWRYVTMNDIWQIFKANAVSSTVFILALLFTHHLTDFPVEIFVIDWALCQAMTSGIRFITRFLRMRFRSHATRDSKNVIIVGAGEAGLLVLNECRNNSLLNASVLGFIDDNPLKKGQLIDGVKVLGGRQDISTIVKFHKIDEIILAIPSAKGEDLRDILSCCDIPDVKIKIVPSFHKVIDGTFEIKPRKIFLEDLLGRKPVDIDKRDVEGYIKDKTVLITGAGGSIGSELCRQIVQYNPEKIILFDHNENDVYFLEVELKTKFSHIKFRTIIGDVQDVRLLKYVFSVYKPKVVFHAAAHKHVPLMEDNPISAVKNNVFGTRNLIYAATHYRVERFVLISTDKAVNPTSMMGATKRIAEILLQAKAKRNKTKFMAVRFGNVIGSSGSVVPLFKKQIEMGGPVTVTHPEVKRYFMSISEATSLVLQAGALGKGAEIFILDMGEQIKIYDLAKNLITLSGMVVGKDIAIEFTGLRSGEKLYEEILHDAENDTLTKHNKIYTARSTEFDASSLRKKIKEMENYVCQLDEKKIVDLVFELIQKPRIIP